MWWSADSRKLAFYRFDESLVPDYFLALHQTNLHSTLAADPAHDRVMICGSPTMLRDTVALLAARGFDEGSSSDPGDYVIERA